MASGQLRILGEELKRRPILVAILVAIVAAGVWFFWPTSTREVKRVIRDAAAIVETKEAEQLRPLLADSFYMMNIGQGVESVDREEAIAVLKTIFENVISIKIKIKDIRVEMRGEQAGAVVDFQVSGLIRGDAVMPQIPFRGLDKQNRELYPTERARLLLVREEDGQIRVSQAELLDRADQQRVRTEEP